MYTIEFDIVGNQPIVFGRYVDPEELPVEKGMKDYEILNKHYYLKCNVNEKEEVVIPTFAIRNCICTAAQKAGQKFKGMKTWAGVFKTGFSCPTNPVLKVKGKTIKCRQIESWSAFLPSNGDTGGKRVKKTFPMVKSDWSMHVVLIVEDDVIDEGKVEEYCVLAGQRVGLGSFRKENNGIWGTFDIKNFKCKK